MTRNYHYLHYFYAEYCPHLRCFYHITSAIALFGLHPVYADPGYIQGISKFSKTKLRVYIFVPLTMFQDILSSTYFGTAQLLPTLFPMSQSTHDEGWSTQRPKCCDNNQMEDNSPHLYNVSN